MPKASGRLWAFTVTAFRHRAAATRADESRLFDQPLRAQMIWQHASRPWPRAPVICFRS